MAVIPSLRINGVNALIASTVFHAGDGSAAAPSITFASAPTWGLYRDNNIGIVMSIAGTDVWSSDSASLILSSSKSLMWGSSTFASPDVKLIRDAANTLALRNSTSAQRLNLGTGDTALAAGRLAMGRDAAAAFAPGAGYGMLRWETGTNAGSLKLVAYSGTSSTGVTVIDNVGSGNA